MSTPLFTTPTDTRTDEQKAIDAANAKRAAMAQFATRLKASAQKMLSDLDVSHRKAFESVWANAHLTPQEALDLLGTDAVRIVTGSGVVSQFLVEQYALAGVPFTPVSLPVGVSMTFNRDGTVTVVGA